MARIGGFKYHDLPNKLSEKVFLSLPDIIYGLDLNLIHNFILFFNSFFLVVSSYKQSKYDYILAPMFIPYKSSHVHIVVVQLCFNRINQIQFRSYLKKSIIWFGLCNGFKVCTGARNLCGFIRDDKY